MKIFDDESRKKIIKQIGRRESNGLLGRAIASHGMYSHERRSHCCDRTGCPGDTGILMEKEHAPISAYYIVLSENKWKINQQRFPLRSNLLSSTKLTTEEERLLLNYRWMEQILNGSRIVVSGNKNNYGCLKITRWWRNQIRTNLCRQASGQSAVQFPPVDRYNLSFFFFPFGPLFEYKKKTWHLVGEKMEQTAKKKGNRIISRQAQSYRAVIFPNEANRWSIDWAILSNRKTSKIKAQNEYKFS